MPMRSDRTKRDRIRRHRSELDWFAEDPWAEPNRPPAEYSLNDWHPGAWGSDEGDLDDEGWKGEDEWNEDSDDEWGPIRPRRKHHKS